MKKITLTIALLATIACAGCSFYEVEEESSLAEVASSIANEDESTTKNPTNCEGKEQIITTFNTIGLDGNNYDESILKGKITLLNFWGTYCSPCISEMPFLASLYKKYQENDFQVVGVLIDIMDSNYNVISTQKTKAEKIVTQAGVTYPSILPCPELAGLLNSIEYIPYSVFVDEHGHQLTDAIVGGMTRVEWDKEIASVLSEYM